MHSDSGMDYKTYFVEQRGRIDRCLDGLIPKDTGVEEAARYTLLAGGHRWRSILAISLAEEYGVATPGLLERACAPECMHAASIILDDLPCMDNAELRRGKPTCHIQYGEAIATLASVHLINTAWHVINEFSQDEHRHALLRKGYDVGSKMVQGQEVDLLDHECSYEKIIQRFSDKSGELYALAVFGALYPVWQEDKMNEFGCSIGIAYQIADDLHDVLSDKTSLGKDVRQDDGLPTLITLGGVDFAREEAKRFKDTALSFVKGREFLVGLIERIVVIP